MVGLVQVLFVFGCAVHHGITIQSPSLSACPGGLISGALCGTLLLHSPCFRIIIDHMVRAIIRTEMILMVVLAWVTAIL